MKRNEMIAVLDQEIERLESARTLLRNVQDVSATLSMHTNGMVTTKKRQISPEGRRRIIEAQRRRWAKQKKQGAAKSK